MISANIAALAYLVAGALFILALRGLSSPTTARRGNTMGMVGMTIAVLTTLAIAAPTDPFAWVLIIGGLAIGGGIGLGAIATEPCGHFGDGLVGVEYDERPHAALDRHSHHRSRVVLHFAQARVRARGVGRVPSRCCQYAGQESAKQGAALHGFAP